MDYRKCHILFVADTKVKILAWRRQEIRGQLWRRPKTSDRWKPI